MFIKILPFVLGNHFDLLNIIVSRMWFISLFLLIFISLSEHSWSSSSNRSLGLLWSCLQSCFFDKVASWMVSLTSFSALFYLFMQNHFCWAPLVGYHICIVSFILFRQLTLVFLHPSFKQWCCCAFEWLW